MKSLTLAASGLLACTLVQADNVVRTPVPDARPVMLAALQSTNGTAFGVLTGAEADAITKQFNATTPIYIDVHTERRYAEPGCARLKVLFWQEGVRLPDAKAARTQRVEFGINYCATGLPPQSLL